jgi:histidine triad (HIT) family protein
MDCLFCKIASGTLPANIVYHDEEIVAFDDIYPKAPQHKLIIPRKHIATLNDLTPEEGDLLGRMTLIAKKLAAEFKIDESGYRVLINCNSDGGQVIYHLHMHLLGGRALHWP